MKAKVVNNHFSTRLNYLVERSNLKIKEIALLLNITPSMLYKWRAGINMPDSSKLDKIAVFFGVSVDYLLGSNNQDEVIVKSAKWERLTKTEQDIVIKNALSLIEQFYKSKNG